MASKLAENIEKLDKMRANQPVEFAVYKGGKEPPEGDWLSNLGEETTFAANYRKRVGLYYKLREFRVVRKGAYIIQLWDALEEEHYWVDPIEFCEIWMHIETIEVSK